MIKRRISVIILSYKNLPGIYDSLDSILVQDYPDIELIFSDDGTPEFDKEEDKLRDYLNKKNKGNITSVIFNGLKVNQGTVKNINSALEKASGS